MGSRRDYLGVEKVCPVCGKSFLVPPLNVYKLPNKKDGYQHYCIYSCFRTEQKKREEGKPYKIDHTKA